MRPESDGDLGKKGLSEGVGQFEKKKNKTIVTGSVFVARRNMSGWHEMAQNRNSDGFGIKPRE